MKKYFIITLFLLTSILMAQTMIDIIYLKDGTIIEGFIIEQVPGEYLVLENQDGQRKKIYFKEVERLRRRKNNTATQKITKRYTPEEVEKMITRKMTSVTIFHMQEASAQLPYDKRKELYEKNKKKAVHGVFNLFPGFGVGSYLQGDKGIAIFQSISEGFSVLFFPLMLAMAKNSDSSGTLDDSDIIMASVISGTMYAGFHIPAMIRPFRYAYSFNKHLKKALHLEDYNDLKDGPKEVSLHLRPVMRFRSSEDTAQGRKKLVPLFGMALNLSLF